MNIDRRTVLKSLAAAGLVVAGMPGAKATATPSATAAGRQDALPAVTALVSGSLLDAAFLAGVAQAVNAAGQDAATESLQGLDTDAFRRLNALLGDGQAGLLVGLVDDASATLVLDLVRSAGGQVLSVHHHRLALEQGVAADQWARQLGSSLVGATAPLAPAAAAHGGAYVSLRCLI